MRYDLHSHSYYSDGTLAPAELVAQAHAAGVEALALTDHDVTDGLAEATDAARRVGLHLISGAELSVTWEGQTLHVVALAIDPAHTGLQAGLAELRARRDVRAEEMARRLARHGIDVYDDVRARARGRILSRTHFAHALVERRHARDLRHAFRQFLRRGAPGYVPCEWAPMSEAIGWIRAAGGHAVLAHPARYKLTSGKLARLLAEFKESGGEAIEVVSGSHSRDDAFRFGALAEKFALFASCGSDYHGPGTWAGLGALAPLPAGCAPLWPRLGITAPAVPLVS